jgi:hypothetical protein
MTTWVIRHRLLFSFALDCRLQVVARGRRGVRGRRALCRHDAPVRVYEIITIS